MSDESGERKLKCNACGHVIDDRPGHRFHEDCPASVLGIYEPIRARLSSQQKPTQDQEG